MTKINVGDTLYRVSKYGDIDTLNVDEVIHNSGSYQVHDKSAGYVWFSDKDIDVSVFVSKSDAFCQAIRNIDNVVNELNNRKYLLTRSIIK